MTGRFTTRGGRPQRISRLASHSITARGNPQPPSHRHGIRWRALPVEGSSAWRRSRGTLFARLFKGA